LVLRPGFAWCRSPAGANLGGPDASFELLEEFGVAGGEDGQTFYIDLLFYHVRLHSSVLWKANERRRCTLSLQKPACLSAASPVFAFSLPFHILPRYAAGMPAPERKKVSVVQCKGCSRIVPSVAAAQFAWSVGPISWPPKSSKANRVGK
jgi:hypothetical protein